MTVKEIMNRIDELKIGINFSRQVRRQHKRELDDDIRKLDHHVEKGLNVSYLVDDIKMRQEIIALADQKIAGYQDELDSLLYDLEVARIREEGYRFRDDVDIYNVIITKGFINGTKL